VPEGPHTLLYEAAHDDLSTAVRLLRILSAKQFDIREVYLVDPWYEPSPEGEKFDEYVRPKSLEELIGIFEHAAGSKIVNREEVLKKGFRAEGTVLRFKLGEDEKPFDVILVAQDAKTFDRAAVRDSRGASFTLVKWPGFGSFLEDDFSFYAKNIEKTAAGGFVYVVDAVLPFRFLSPELAGLRAIPTDYGLNRDLRVRYEHLSEINLGALFAKESEVPAEILERLMAIDRALTELVSKAHYYAPQGEVSRARLAEWPGAWRKFREALRQLPENFRGLLAEDIAKIRSARADRLKREGAGMLDFILGEIRAELRSADPLEPGQTFRLGKQTLVMGGIKPIRRPMKGYESGDVFFVQLEPKRMPGVWHTGWILQVVREEGESTRFRFYPAIERDKVVTVTHVSDTPNGTDAVELTGDMPMTYFSGPVVTQTVQPAPEEFRFGIKINRGRGGKRGGESFSVMAGPNVMLHLYRLRRGLFDVFGVKRSEIRAGSSFAKIRLTDTSLSLKDYFPAELWDKEVEQMVLVADNTGTLTPGYDKQLSESIRSPLLHFAKIPGNYFVVDSGDPIHNLEHFVYEPFMSELQGSAEAAGEPLGRFHFVGDSGTKRKGFGQNAYDEPAKPWNTRTQFEYLRALAEYFYDELLKRPGHLAEALKGVGDERLKAIRDEHLGELDRLGAEGFWRRQTETESSQKRAYHFHLLPEDLEKILSPIYVYEVGAKVTLGTLLGGRTAFPASFTAPIYERFSARFGPSAPGFYTVSGDGFIDIAAESKQSGAQKTLDEKIYPALDPEKVTVIFVIGDNSNDIPMFGVKLPPEFKKAVVIPVFLNHSESFSEILPQGALLPREKSDTDSLDGSVSFLEFLASIRGKRIREIPDFPAKQWRFELRGADVNIATEVLEDLQKRLFSLSEDVWARLSVLEADPATYEYRNDLLGTLYPGIDYGQKIVPHVLSFDAAKWYDLVRLADALQQLETIFSDREGRANVGGLAYWLFEDINGLVARHPDFLTPYLLERIKANRGLQSSAVSYRFKEGHFEGRFSYGPREISDLYRALLDQLKFPEGTVWKDFEKEKRLERRLRGILRGSPVGTTPLFHSDQSFVSLEVQQALFDLILLSRWMPTLDEGGSDFPRCVEAANGILRLYPGFTEVESIRDDLSLSASMTSGYQFEGGGFNFKKERISYRQILDEVASFTGLQASRGIVVPGQNEYGISFSTLPDMMPDLAQRLREHAAAENKRSADLRILDVGTDRGAVAVGLAEETGADVTSVEIEPARHSFAKDFVEDLEGRKGWRFPRLKLLQGDFLEQDIRNYDAIYFFFSTGEGKEAAFAEAILEKLNREMKDSAIFISPLFARADNIGDAVLKKFFGESRRIHYRKTWIGDLPAIAVSPDASRLSGFPARPAPMDFSRSELRGTGLARVFLPIFLAGAFAGQISARDIPEMKISGSVVVQAPKLEEVSASANVRSGGEVSGLDSRSRLARDLFYDFLDRRLTEPPSAPDTLVGRIITVFSPTLDRRGGVLADIEYTRHELENLGPLRPEVLAEMDRSISDYRREYWREWSRMVARVTGMFGSLLGVAYITFSVIARSVREPWAKESALRRKTQSSAPGDSDMRDQEPQRAAMLPIPPGGPAARPSDGLSRHEMRLDEGHIQNAEADETFDRFVGQLRAAPRLNFSAPSGERIRTVMNTGSYDALYRNIGIVVIDLFPDEKELAEHSELQALTDDENQRETEGLPLPGSFGSVSVQWVQNELGETGLLIDEIQASPGFYRLGKEAKDYYGAWKKALVMRILQFAASSGVRNFYASSAKRMSGKYPSMSRGNLYQHYIYPFQKWWRKSSFVYANHAFKFWHLSGSAEEIERLIVPESPALLGATDRSEASLSGTPRQGRAEMRDLDALLDQFPGDEEALHRFIYAPGNYLEAHGRSVFERFENLTDDKKRVFERGMWKKDYRAAIRLLVSEPVFDIPWSDNAAREHFGKIDRQATPKTYDLLNRLVTMATVMPLDVSFSEKNGFEFLPSERYGKSIQEYIGHWKRCYLELAGRNPEGVLALLAWKILAIGPRWKKVIVPPEQVLALRKLFRYDLLTEENFDPLELDRTVQLKIAKAVLDDVKTELGGVSVPQAMIELNTDAVLSSAPNHSVIFEAFADEKNRLQFYSGPQEHLSVNPVGDLVPHTRIHGDWGIPIAEWGVSQMESKSAVFGKPSWPMFRGVMEGGLADEGEGGVFLGLPLEAEKRRLFFDRLRQIYGLKEGDDQGVQIGAVIKLVSLLRVLGGKYGIHRDKRLFLEFSLLNWLDRYFDLRFQDPKQITLGHFLEKTAGIEDWVGRSELRSEPNSSGNTSTALAMARIYPSMVAHAHSLRGSEPEKRLKAKIREDLRLLGARGKARFLNNPETGQMSLLARVRAKQDALAQDPHREVWEFWAREVKRAWEIAQEESAQRKYFEINLEPFQQLEISGLDFTGRKDTDLSIEVEWLEDRGNGLETGLLFKSSSEDVLLTPRSRWLKGALARDMSETGIPREMKPFVDRAGEMVPGHFEPYRKVERTGWRGMRYAVQLKAREPRPEQTEPNAYNFTFFAMKGASDAGLAEVAIRIEKIDKTGVIIKIEEQELIGAVVRHKDYMGDLIREWKGPQKVVPPDIKISNGSKIRRDLAAQFELIETGMTVPGSSYVASADLGKFELAAVFDRRYPEAGMPFLHFYLGQSNDLTGNMFPLFTLRANKPSGDPWNDALYRASFTEGERQAFFSGDPELAKAHRFRESVLDRAQLPAENDLRKNLKGKLKEAIGFVRERLEKTGAKMPDARAHVQEAAGRFAVELPEMEALMGQFYEGRFESVAFLNDALTGIKASILAQLEGQGASEASVREIDKSNIPIAIVTAALTALKEKMQGRPGLKDFIDGRILLWMREKRESLGAPEVNRVIVDLKHQILDPRNFPWPTEENRAAFLRETYYDLQKMTLAEKFQALEDQVEGQPEIPLATLIRFSEMVDSLFLFCKESRFMSDLRARAVPLDTRRAISVYPLWTGGVLTLPAETQGAGEAVWRSGTGASFVVGEFGMPADPYQLGPRIAENGGPSVLMVPSKTGYPNEHQLDSFMSDRRKLRSLYPDAGQIWLGTFDAEGRVRLFAPKSAVDDPGRSEKIYAPVKVLLSNIGDAFNEVLSPFFADNVPRDFRERKAWLDKRADFAGKLLPKLGAIYGEVPAREVLEEASRRYRQALLDLKDKRYERYSAFGNGISRFQYSLGLFMGEWMAAKRYPFADFFDSVVIDGLSEPWPDLKPGREEEAPPVEIDYGPQAGELAKRMFAQTQKNNQCRDAQGHLATLPELTAFALQYLKNGGKNTVPGFRDAWNRVVDAIKRLGETVSDSVDLQKLLDESAQVAELWKAAPQGEAILKARVSCAVKFADARMGELEGETDRPENAEPDHLRKMRARALDLAGVLEKFKESPEFSDLHERNRRISERFGHLEKFTAWQKRIEEVDEKFRQPVETKYTLAQAQADRGELEAVVAETADVSEFFTEEEAFQSLLVEAMEKLAGDFTQSMTASLRLITGGREDEVPETVSLEKMIENVQWLRARCRDLRAEMRGSPEEFLAEAQRVLEAVRAVHQARRDVAQGKFGAAIEGLAPWVTAEGVAERLSGFALAETLAGLYAEVQSGWETEKAARQVRQAEVYREMESLIASAAADLTSYAELNGFEAVEKMRELRERLLNQQAFFDEFENLAALRAGFDRVLRDVDACQKALDEIKKMFEILNSPGNPPYETMMSVAAEALVSGRTVLEFLTTEGASAWRKTLIAERIGFFEAIVQRTLGRSFEEAVETGPEPIDRVLKMAEEFRDPGLSTADIVRKDLLFGHENWDEAYRGWQNELTRQKEMLEVSKELSSWSEKKIEEITEWRIAMDEIEGLWQKSAGMIFPQAGEAAPLWFVEWRNAFHSLREEFISRLSIHFITQIDDSNKHYSARDANFPEAVDRLLFLSERVLAMLSEFPGHHEIFEEAYQELWKRSVKLEQNDTLVIRDPKTGDRYEIYLMYTSAGVLSIRVSMPVQAVMMDGQRLVGSGKVKSWRTRLLSQLEETSRSNGPERSFSLRIPKSSPSARNGAVDILGLVGFSSKDRIDREEIEQAGDEVSELKELLLKFPVLVERLQILDQYSARLRVSGDKHLRIEVKKGNFVRPKPSVPPASKSVLEREIEVGIDPKNYEAWDDETWKAKVVWLLSNLIEGGTRAALSENDRKAVDSAYQSYMTHYSGFLPEGIRMLSAGEYHAKYVALVLPDPGRHAERKAMVDDLKETFLDLAIMINRILKTYRADRVLNEPQGPGNSVTEIPTVEGRRDFYRATFGALERNHGFDLIHVMRSGLVVLPDTEDTVESLFCLYPFLYFRELGYEPLQLSSRLAYNLIALDNSVVSVSIRPPDEVGEPAYGVVEFEKETGRHQGRFWRFFLLKKPMPALPEQNEYAPEFIREYFVMTPEEIESELGSITVNPEDSNRRRFEVVRSLYDAVSGGRVLGQAHYRLLSKEGASAMAKFFSRGDSPEAVEEAEAMRLYYERRQVMDDRDAISRNPHWREVSAERLESFYQHWLGYAGVLGLPTGNKAGAIADRAHDVFIWQAAHQLIPAMSSRGLFAPLVALGYVQSSADKERFLLDGKLIKDTSGDDLLAMTASASSEQMPITFERGSADDEVRQYYDRLRTVLKKHAVSAEKLVGNLDIFKAAVDFPPELGKVFDAELLQFLAVQLFPNFARRGSEVRGAVVETAYRLWGDSRIRFSPSARFRIDTGKTSIEQALERDWGTLWRLLSTQTQMAQMVPGTLGTGSGNLSPAVPGTVALEDLREKILEGEIQLVLRDMPEVTLPQVQVNTKIKVFDRDFPRLLDEVAQTADKPRGPLTVIKDNLLKYREAIEAAEAGVENVRRLTGGLLEVYAMRLRGQQETAVREKLETLRPYAGRHLDKLETLARSEMPSSRLELRTSRELGRSPRSEMRAEEEDQPGKKKGFDWRGMLKAAAAKLAQMVPGTVGERFSEPVPNVPGTVAPGAVALQELTASREQAGGILYELAERLIERAMTEELSRKTVETDVESFRKTIDAEMDRIAGKYLLSPGEIRTLNQSRDSIVKKLEADMLEARKLKREADRQKAEEAKLLEELEAEERARLAREAEARAEAERIKAEADRLEQEKRIAEADQALRKMLRKIRKELPPAIAGIEDEESLGSHALVTEFRIALEGSPLAQERQKQLAGELDIILKPLADRIRSRSPKSSAPVIGPAGKKQEPAKAPDSEDPEIQWVVAKLGAANRAVQRHLYQDALGIYREIIRHSGIPPDKRAKALLGAAHAIEMLTKSIRQRDQRQAYDVEGFGYCQQLVEMQGIQKDLKSHGFLSGSRFLSDERLYQDAVDFLDEGLKRDPANVNLLTQKAWVFFYWSKADRNSEKLSAACRIADDVLRQTPGLLPAYKVKFAAMEARGDAPAALEKVLEEAERFDSGTDRRNSLADYRERLENLKRQRSELRAEDRGAAGQREAEKAASLKNVVQTVIDELHKLSNDDLEGKKFYYLEILRDTLTSSGNPLTVFTMLSQIWSMYPKAGHSYMKPSRAALQTAMLRAKDLMPEEEREKWDVFSLRKSKNTGPRSELRLAAGNFLRELAGRGVPVTELEESARVTVRVGIRSVIDELLRMKDIVNRRWQTAIERVVDQLTFDSAGESSGVYAVAYSIQADKNPIEIGDFVDSVISFGVIKQVMLPPGQKFPDEVTKRLKAAGVTISRPGARQKTVFLGDQEIAGFIAKGDSHSKRGQSPMLRWTEDMIPIISIGESQSKDPQLARLVITLQTAVALLVAREARKGNRMLKAELIRQLNELFPGAGNSVIQVQGENLVISSDVIYQALITSVMNDRMTATAA
jgi:hypothetical protein